MAGMKIVRELDRNRIKYEAMIQRFGDKAANTAYRRALDQEGKKTNTAIKNTLVKQTSIKKGEVNKSISFIGPSRDNLSFKIVGTGRHRGLRNFGAVQFSYGVRVKDMWGKKQRKFKSAFIVPRLNAHAFVRTGSARFPIRVMYGPSIPKEMVKDEARDVFDEALPNLHIAAIEKLKQALKV